jgi:hypothetical protein
MLSTPFLLEYLTNAAWREISEKSGLPDEARPKIDEALHPYRAWQRSKSLIKTPADTKGDLRELADTFDQATERLSTVLSNPRGKVALIDAVIKASADEVLKHEAARRAVESWISQIDVMRATTLRAGKSIAGGRRGAWEGARVLALLVLQLDQILFGFTGKHITRSRKGHQNARDYITAVCRVADTNISPSSIDEAMKAVITGRGRKKPRKRR